MQKTSSFLPHILRAVLPLTALAACLISLSPAQAQQAPPTAQQTPPPAATPAKPSATGSAQTPAPKKPAGTGPRAAQRPLTLNTDKDKVSYAIGMNVGKAMKRDGVDVDTAILIRGFQDALAGTTPLLSDQEAQTVMTALQTDLRKKQEEKQKGLADSNKKEGDEFLATNKTKEGVVGLPSGLQYKILQEGTGPKPTANDTVTVNYRGTLVNGTEFDSSYKRGQPASFPVGGIIKGWTEALELMPVGSKWQLYIPADLAYGPRQAGPNIGPNSTLIFDVELLSIQPKPAPAPAPAAAPAAAPATPPPAPKPNPAPSPTPTRKP
jgi:FKBP-type peptidyl-prolyl cis-trans isomerase FklB